MVVFAARLCLDPSSDMGMAQMVKEKIKITKQGVATLRRACPQREERAQYSRAIDPWNMEDIEDDTELFAFYEGLIYL